MKIHYNYIGYVLCVGSLITLYAQLYSHVIKQTIDDTILIDQPGDWILDDNLTLHGLQSIIITASDVVFNLNDKKITGADNAEVAIAIHGNNCIVKNGELYNFIHAGITLHAVEEALIENISVHDTHNGISIIGGSCNRLSNVTITRSHSSGLTIKDATHTHVTQCTITACKEYGVYIDGLCDGSLCNSLTIQQCGECSLYLGSNNMQCSYAQVQNSDKDGVLIKGNNIACFGVCSAHNSTGFHIYGSNVTLHTCTAVHNIDDGLVVEAESSNVKILGGVYSANGNVGINNYAQTTKVYGISAHANGKCNTMRVFNSIV